MHLPRALGRLHTQTGSLARWGAPARAAGRSIAAASATDAPPLGSGGEHRALTQLFRACFEVRDDLVVPPEEHGREKGTPRLA